MLLDKIERWIDRERGTQGEREWGGEKEVVEMWE